MKKWLNMKVRITEEETAGPNSSLCADTQDAESRLNTWPMAVSAFSGNAAFIRQSEDPGRCQCDNLSRGSSTPQRQPRQSAWSDSRLPLRKGHLA